ncbi:MAG: hypothetical protein AAGH40_04225 [Verrucomicrobiota bacterium]
MNLYQKLLSIIPIIGLLIIAGNCNAEPQNSVSVDLTAITLSGGLKGIKYESGGKVESLSVFKNVRSPPFRYVGSPEVIFFRELGTINDSDTPQRKVVGRMLLPASTGEFLVVFSKLPGKEESYRVTPLPDSLTVFRPGMYRFRNMSPYTVAIQVGEERTLIPKYGFKDLESKGDESQYQNTLIISLPDEKQFEGAKPYQVFSGSMFFSSNLRTIYIMTPISGGRPGRIKLESIVERVSDA